MFSRNQFEGSKFGIFRGFGWVHSSILVDESGFGRVRNSVFPDLGLSSAHFWPNRFVVQFCWKNLGSSEFEVRPDKIKAVQSS